MCNSCIQLDYTSFEAFHFFLPKKVVHSPDSYAQISLFTNPIRCQVKEVISFLHKSVLFFISSHTLTIGRNRSYCAVCAISSHHSGGHHWNPSSAVVHPFRSAKKKPDDVMPSLALVRPRKIWLQISAFALDLLLCVAECRSTCVLLSSSSLFFFCFWSGLLELLCFLLGFIFCDSKPSQPIRHPP